MPKRVQAYQANDGTLFADECLAATRDVELLVGDSPLAENQPYARKVVEWLTANTRDIRKVLETFEGACPIAAVEVASENRSKGPGAKDPEREESKVPEVYRPRKTLASFDELRPHSVACRARAIGDLDACDCPVSDDTA